MVIVLFLICFVFICDFDLFDLLWIWLVYCGFWCCACVLCFGGIGISLAFRVVFSDCSLGCLWLLVVVLVPEVVCGYLTVACLLVGFSFGF